MPAITLSAMSLSGRDDAPTSPKIMESNAVGRDQSQREDSFLLKYRHSFGSYTRKVLSMFTFSSSARKYFTVSWDKCIPEPQPPLTWRSVVIFPLALTAAEIEQHLTLLKTSHLKEKNWCSFKEEYEMHSSNTERRNRRTSMLRERKDLSKLSLFPKCSHFIKVISQLNKPLHYQLSFKRPLTVVRYQ